MAKPVKPTAPAQALRSNPESFSANAEGTIAYLFTTFPDYTDDIADFVDQRADQALAAALGGDLPDLTGNANKLLAVNPTEDAAILVSDLPDGTTATTQSAGDDSDLLATTAFVQNATSFLVTPGQTPTVTDATVDATGLSYIRTLAVIEQIDGGVDGQHLFVSGVSVTLGGSCVDSGTASTAPSPNINLASGITSRTILGGDVLHLIYKSGGAFDAWYEVSYTNG